MYLLRLSGPDTQTSDAERQCLRKYAVGRRSLVEIGVYHGVNTRLLCESADPSAVVYAVDPFFTGKLGVSFNRMIAHSHVARAYRGRCVWIRDVSPTAASPGYIPSETSFDFVFIDGDHSYEAVRLDWETWTPRLTIGGIVALHDSRGGLGAGSEVFTNEVIRTDQRFEVLETVDTLTVLGRRA